MTARRARPWRDEFLSAINRADTTDTVLALVRVEAARLMESRAVDRPAYDGIMAAVDKRLEKLKVKR